MKRKWSERGFPLKNKPKAILIFSTVLLCTIAVSLVQSKLNANKALKSTQTEEGKPKTVKKTEEEWKKILTPEQFRILRKAGTERPNGDVYYEFKKQGAGTYYCAGCDTELFSSNEKFDSRCGWPSFYDPSKAKNVKTSVDYLLGYPRTEVLCAVCDGHLGHVFTGEGFDTPTDKRYCINGSILKFVPKEQSTEEESPDEDEVK
jgi:peptide-methionine (R)-S-oxide reductase